MKKMTMPKLSRTEKTKVSLMDKELIFFIEEVPEGGYTAKALGYSIFTEADNEAELRHNIQDAVRCHFDEQTPRILRLHFVRDEVLEYA